MGAVERWAATRPEIQSTAGRTICRFGSIACKAFAVAGGEQHMRFDHPIAEAEMVAHFLLTELRSERFGTAIRRLLERKQLAPAIIEHPDLNDLSENGLRADLLGEWRGYGRDGDVFKDFPDDVQWWRAFLSSTDLERIKYLNDAYWIDFSGGSRLVRDAATRIVGGAMPDVAAGYRSLAQALESGARFPELILLYNPREDELVVLEGHVRVTAYLVYLLMSETTVLDIPVLIGCSDRLKK